MPAVTFVTGNKNKLREVCQLLGPAWTVHQRAVDVPEIQGSTADIARAKATAAAAEVRGPCITEDTALEFDALDGLPGPYIKHFLASIGLDGLNTLLHGFSSTAATAVCTFAYCAGPGHEPVLCVGTTRGSIVPPRGSREFGWDPIFQVQDTHLTYAEMSPEQKNSLSHRAKALEKLREAVNL